MEKDPIPRWTAQKRLAMSSRRFQSSGTRSARPFSLAPLTRDNAVTLLYKWLSVTVIDVTIEFFLSFFLSYFFFFSFLLFSFSFFFLSLFFFSCPVIDPADRPYLQAFINTEANEFREEKDRFSVRFNRDGWQRCVALTPL